MSSNRQAMSGVFGFLVLSILFSACEVHGQVVGTGFLQKTEHTRLHATTNPTLRERFGTRIETVTEYPYDGLNSTQTTLVIVSHPHTPTGGQIWIFRLDEIQVNHTVVVNATTNVTQTVIEDDWVQIARFAGSDTVVGDGFGSSLSASKDGRVIAVGAPMAENAAESSNYDMNGANVGRPPAYQWGRVYIFTETVPGGGNWAQTAFIDFNFFAAQSGYFPQYMDLFGMEVKLNEEGTELIVNCVSVNSTKRGLYVFAYNNNTSAWEWKGVQLSDNLIVPPGMGTKGPRFTATPHFEYIVVRTNNATKTMTTSTDQVTIYERTPNTFTWTKVQEHDHNEQDNRTRWFGWDMAIDPEDLTILVGAPLFDGEVSMYTLTSRNPAQWTYAGSFFVPIAARNYFGVSVDIRNTSRGRFAVVGAPFQEGNEKGVAYLYQYNETSAEWMELYKLESSLIVFNQLTSPLTSAGGTDFRAATGDMFGGDVMIADRHVIVGAELEGAAYVFKLPELPVPQATEPEPSIPVVITKPAEKKSGLQLIYILIIAIGAGGLLLIAGVIAGILVYRRIRKNKLLKLAAKYKEMQGVEPEKQNFINPQ